MKKLITQIVFVAITYTYGIAQNGPQLRRIEGQGNDGLVLDFVAGMHDSILAGSCLYNYPLYDNNKGPVYVDIYNPSITPPGDYQIVFNGALDTAKWKLVYLPTNTTVFGNSTTGVNYTQDIPQWGIKIRTTCSYDSGPYAIVPLIFPPNNGFLEATMTYADTTKQWLKCVPDHEGVDQFNWIRCGIPSPAPSGNPQYEDYPAYQNRDEIEAFEKVLGGTWAPYCLCAWTQLGGSPPYIGGPAWNNTIANSQIKIKNLASIDVVITSDQSKWTRCPVLELQEDSMLAIGHAKKLDLRKSASVDKNGVANYPSSANNDFATGMGWFPGYAINLETGERLNMAFGEDSWLTGENGSDMLWNPTTAVSTVAGTDPIYGGKHYIYVFGHNGNQVYPGTQGNGMAGKLKDVPCYDAGKAIHELMDADLQITTFAYKREVFVDAMWVNIPMLNPGHNLLETEVSIRLRVSKKYKQFSVNNVNNTNPMYIFNTGSLVGIKENKKEVIQVNIYPNPSADNITIKSSAKNYNIKMYDATGRLVKNMEHVSSAVTIINIENLDNGIYLLNVFDGKNSSVERFIKQ